MRQDRTTRVAEIAARMLAANGVSATDSPRTAEALKILDPESVGSVPGILGLLAQTVAGIERDPELSAEGKRTRIRAAADGRLGNIASLAKAIARLETEHRRDADEAVPIPAAEVGDVLLDLALAGHLRDVRPIPSKLLNMSERVRLAAARVPPELSGLTPEVAAKARGSLMNPQTAVRLGNEAAALDAARRAVQGAIDELAPVAKWTPSELVKHIGPEWRLPGVAPSMAERLTAEAGE